MEFEPKDIEYADAVVSDIRDQLDTMQSPPILDKLTPHRLLQFLAEQSTNNKAHGVVSAWGTVATP